MTTPTIPTPPSHSLFSTSLSTSLLDTMSNFDETATSWPDPFGAVRDYSPTSVTQSIHPDWMPAPQHLSTAGTSLPGFNATINTSFTPVHTSSMEAFTNLATQPNHTYPGVPDAWPMLAQTFFDASPVVTQPVGTYQWTGIAPLAPNSAVATPNQVVGSGSSTIPPVYQDEPVWLFGQGRSNYYMPSSFSGSGSEAGLITPEYSANVSGVTIYPVEWGTTEVAMPIPTATVVATRKRCHKEEVSHSDEGTVVTGTHDVPPQKRAKGGTSNGIPKANRSAVRTRNKPAARIPKQNINGKPKKAGRGAEKLATPNSQGMYRQSLLGPSYQRGWAAEAADGRLIWVEGSMKKKAVQQRQQEAEGELFKIPKKFKVGHKALLAATQADWDRGAIREIKCRLCPDTKLKTWEDFKRHCDTMESHPLKISFCDFCGDFFARVDSLERHHNNPPPECYSVALERADEKRRETQKAHDEFLVRLEEFLRTGEGIGMPFSQIIKEKYPESSKKRIGGGKERN